MLPQSARSALCVVLVPILGLCDCGGRTPLYVDGSEDTEIGSDSTAGASGWHESQDVGGGNPHGSRGGGGANARGTGGHGTGGHATGGHGTGGHGTGGHGTGGHGTGGHGTGGRGIGGQGTGGQGTGGSTVAPGCGPAVDEGRAGLCNGLDDDCDGMVDEGCGCTPGAVQSCFQGPPGRRGVGACHDGMQSCTSEGDWGACEGGISPVDEVCDGLDNDCNGWVDDMPDCKPVVQCPASGDPRIPKGRPFRAYPLRGGDFFAGDARSFSWTVSGGPCDGFAEGKKSFDVQNPTRRDAELIPRLSGDYTVTLEIVTRSGETLSCTWIVQIAGPGLRVEMCYPENTTQDLDLYVKQPGHDSPWFTEPSAFSPADDQCDWHNCEAELRPTNSGLHGRAAWGYPSSDLAECVGGPQGARWNALGYCPNPRLDIDNNLTSDQGTGVPENINIDHPNDGDTFRIMVQNFTGTPAHPVVNVYCSGQRIATYGVSPDELTNFQGSSGYDALGAMWHVADVTTRLRADGQTRCEVRPLRPPNSMSGYVVTYDDPAF